MSGSTGVPKLLRRELLQAAAALLLCAFGLVLVHRDPAEVRTVLATAGGCSMPVDIYEPRSGTPSGSVVLLHGLSANKKVMQFTAQEFANQELRVYVPDLPGHGKAPGPFSPARAETCALALVRDLAARKAILPGRTILAGHSMGGAIATRVGAQIPVAGVIAISPAPMEPSKDVSSELLLFISHPKLPAHSLVLSAAWEPAAIRKIARDLVSESVDPTSKYEVVPRTTHVSILFDRSTFERMRSWTAQILGTSESVPPPQSRPALGCLLGIAGLSLLTPPFLREITQQRPNEATAKEICPVIPMRRSVFTVALLSAGIVLVLSFVNPLRFLRLFQGDYFTALLLLVGVGLLAIHRKSLPASRSFCNATTLASAAAAVVLLLLFAAWFELTFHEAWLTAARWLRFPALFLLFLPWHLAEELLVGAPRKSPNVRRLILALALRGIVWLSAVGGVFYLHSGKFIFVLLVAYFALFSLLQRLAIDAVSARTRSLSAAAVFGAILLAGFVLAILPVA